MRTFLYWTWWYVRCSLSSDACRKDCALILLLRRASSSGWFQGLRSICRTAPSGLVAYYFYRMLSFMYFVLAFASGLAIKELGVAVSRFWV